MTRRRTWVINGVLVVLLGGAGFGIYQAFTPASNTAQAQTRSTSVRRATVTETVSAAGTLASSYTGSANFGTSGKVTAIDVNVGDSVTAGQKLATLDSTQASKQLQVAKANLTVAQEQLTDAIDASENPAPPPATGKSTSSSSTSSTTNAAENVNSAQAKLDQAQLDVDNAQSAVDATVLTAPGSGTITAINGAVGQQAGSSGGSSQSSASSSAASGGTGSGQGSGAGTGSANSAASSSSSSSSSGFITITNLGGLVVNTNIAEIDVSKVKAGQKATVTLNALPDQPVQATVSSVSMTPTTSSGVVTYAAQLALTNPPAGLRPGQSASVVVTVAEADNALSVPAAAVVTAGNTNIVTVNENGQNVPRQVQIGIRGESTVQITSGLTEGDQVVLTATAPTTGTTGANGQRGGGLGGFGGGQGGFPSGGGGGKITTGGGGGRG